MNAFWEGAAVFVSNWRLITGMLVIFVIIFIPLRRLKSDPGPASVATGLFLLLFFSLSLLLRLAYVSGALFPQYFDSAQHYALIKNILNSGTAWMFNGPTVTYYHLGFHFLAAFFVSVFRVEITQVMLILGQVILALIPFPLYFLIRHATKSNMAGWLTIILAAFGWYMPAHAVDWGKYPALMSLGMISFVLMMACLNVDSASLLANSKTVSKRWIFYSLFGVSALLTIFTHSRSLVVFIIVFLAWKTSVWVQKLSQRRMFFVFILVAALTLSEVFFIQRQSILALLFDPYLNKGVLITALVLVLSIFAWTAYPRLTFVCVLTMTFVLGSLFIPVTIIPGYRDMTLLDRPYVEMVLFLPLSLLGGLGLAALDEKLQGRFTWGRYVGLLAIGIVAVSAFFSYDLYPSGCCVIVGNDDVLAMDWMANQLPVDARIGISSTQLKVMASEISEGDVGADAGIWVMPLTGRTTIALPNTSAFDQEPALKSLCELGIDYLFVGEAGQPFDAVKILARPEWYRPLLSMPKTGVYEVIGCDQ